jgi:hypothetical protein
LLCFPRAASERKLASIKKTGNRIRYRKVDAETGNEVDSSEIINGYEFGKGQYIEIEPEELEAPGRSAGQHLHVSLPSLPCPACRAVFQRGAKKRVRRFYR